MGFSCPKIVREERLKPHVTYISMQQTRAMDPSNATRRLQSPLNSLEQRMSCLFLAQLVQIALREGRDNGHGRAPINITRNDSVNWQHVHV